jgi:enterochelin esterase family protein
VPDPREVSFELVDRSGRLAGVRLQQEIGLAGPLDFVRTRGTWRLTIEAPDVLRMEYLFELRYSNDARMTVPDPANPLRAPGAFGEKSVLEFDGYQPPVWLAAVPVESSEDEFAIDVPELDGAVEVTVWTPAGLEPDTPAPLVVAHDGPEFARLGGLTHYLGAAIAAGDVPPLRAALVGPGDRNLWYSANPAYAKALCEQVLDTVDEIAPASARIGVGVSLGALAMLHAHHSYPERFDGLLLQSGSFFTADLDPQESTFSGFDAVAGFVRALQEADADARPVPAVLTCGTVEENLANNKSMTATLHRLGYAARLVTVRDAHNYTAWRDALDPHLTTLLTDVVGARAA